LSRIDSVEVAGLEEDDHSASGGPVSLDAHSDDVARFASAFAKELVPAFAADLELTGRFHDAGKADMRFQALLRACTVLEASLTGELLAKSDGLPARPSERRRIQSRAGYPQGARHELVSTRLLESATALASAHDRELVLHLIASHHGWCRPFAPVCDEQENASVTITLHDITLTTPAATGLERCDSGVAERFWRLVRRYGWWGVAYLEAVFRLADHTASRQREDVLPQEQPMLEVLV
jgi:CRISPR-associated endonuclease/helicase Cas3